MSRPRALALRPYRSHLDPPSRIPRSLNAVELDSRVKQPLLRPPINKPRSVDGGARPVRGHYRRNTPDPPSWIPRDLTQSRARSLGAIVKFEPPQTGAYNRVPGRAEAITPPQFPRSSKLDPQSPRRSRGLDNLENHGEIRTTTDQRRTAECPAAPHQPAEIKPTCESFL